LFTCILTCPLHSILLPLEQHHKKATSQKISPCVWLLGKERMVCPCSGCCCTSVVLCCETLWPCGDSAWCSGREMVLAAALHAAPSLCGQHHDFSQVFQLKWYTCLFHRLTLSWQGQRNSIYIYQLRTEGCKVGV